MVRNEVIDLSNNRSLLRSSFLRMSRNFGGSCDIPKTAVKETIGNDLMFSLIVVWIDYDFIVGASPTQLAKLFCGSVVEVS